MDQAMKKRVLMVCYYYPPIIDVGAKRSVAFSKYMEKYNWEPHVLSVKNPDKAYCTAVKTNLPPPGVHTEYSYSIINLYNILGKLNGIVSRILRPFNVFPMRNYFYDLVCIPDVFVGWIPLTIVKAFRIISKLNIDIIYVSCSPFSSAIIGVVLKHLTKKPLIVDFRDPFALPIRGLIFQVPRFRQSFDRRIEKFIINHADLFLVTSRETADAYKKEYPRVGNKMVTIHNGFDKVYLRKPPKKHEKFTIIYTGLFYFVNENNEKPGEAFFEALKALKRGGKIARDNFQFLYYGFDTRKIKAITRQYDIDDIVHAQPQIPYKEALREISKSHLFLLRIVQPMISTKLFEGLALNTPFLATIPSGEVEEIIRRYSASSYIIHEATSPQIMAAIEDALKQYSDNSIVDNRVDEFLNDFSRESLTKKMIVIADERLPVANEY